MPASWNFYSLSLYGNKIFPFSDIETDLIEYSLALLCVMHDVSNEYIILKCMRWKKSGKDPDYGYRQFVLNYNIKIVILSKKFLNHCYRHTLEWIKFVSHCRSDQIRFGLSGTFQGLLRQISYLKINFTTHSFRLNWLQIHNRQLVSWIGVTLYFIASSYNSFCLLMLFGGHVCGFYC